VAVILAELGTGGFAGVTAERGEAMVLKGRMNKSIVTKVSKMLCKSKCGKVALSGLVLKRGESPLPLLFEARATTTEPQLTF
jgi:hypothetical protein